jgi:hypothetical protein
MTTIDSKTQVADKLDEVIKARMAFDDAAAAFRSESSEENFKVLEVAMLVLQALDTELARARELDRFYAH